MLIFMKPFITAKLKPYCVEQIALRCHQMSMVFISMIIIII